MKAYLSLGTEILEDRIAPATITNPLSIGETTTATFTDADGDIVTVRIDGKAGSVSFFDAGGNAVDDGEDIASVEITGASSDFTLTYSVDAVSATGAVQMGNITSNKIIRGIFSVPDSAVTSSFNLGSFKGINFSAGGGLSVDNIVGDAADVGLELTGGLHKDATLTIRNNVDADLNFGDSLKDVIDGTVIVGGTGTMGSDLTFAGKVGTNFSWVQDNSFNGAVTFNGAFNGTIDIDGDTDGAWNFEKGVGSQAQLHSDDWNDVNVTGHFAGIISSESSAVIMDVSGDLKSTARIQSSQGYTLAIGGNVLPGATAASDSGATFTVGGNMMGTFMAGSGDFVGTIAGNVKGATIVGSSDVSITVAGDVVNSTIEADNNLFLDVDGGITNSDISTGHEVVTLTVDGSIKNSRFSGETTGTIGGSITDSQFRASGFDDVTLTVGGGVTRTLIDADSEIVLNVTGNVSSSRFISTTGGVSLTVAGNLVKTTAISSDDDIVLDVDGDVDGTFLTDDNSQTWTIGGNFRGLFDTGSGDLTMSVGGSVLKGSQFLQGDSLLLAVEGDFDAIVISDELELTVGGDVKSGTRITVNEVSNQGGADSVGFAVGGDFAGVLNTSFFDPNSDITADQTHELVGGDVTKTARFNIGDIAETSNTDTYAFAGEFLGRLAIGGDLDVDLNFAGAVARIVVGGVIRDTVTVEGKLTELVAGGSLFEATSDTAGNFKDQNGVVTGNLIANGGFKSVLPTLPV
jgi:fibronectin-binding autotransporter adhesin